MGHAKWLALLVALVTPIVSAGPEPNAGFGAPQLIAPANHAALARLEALQLTWDGAQDAHYQVQVLPTNGDGPGFEARVTGPSYTFQAPDLKAGPYVMLPGTVYAWRVRAGSDEDASMGWSKVRTFSTPGATPSTIAAREPAPGGTATGVAPALEWTDKDPHVFWYEVQLSVDSAFPPTPSTGNRAVYANRVHGGMSTPLRSWRVPEESFLEYEQRYYWRVRPVIQGETPAEWSRLFSFGTPAAPALPEPEPESELVYVAPARPYVAPAAAASRQAGAPALQATAAPAAAPELQAAAAPAAAPAVQTPAAPAAAPTLQAPAAPAVAPAPSVNQVGNHGAVLSLINQIRASNGLGTLASNGQLAAAAQAHSNDMAGQNSMSHTGSNGSDPSVRISASGYQWQLYGEIVAAGQTTPQAVVNAWMNSPSHKAVILTAGLREFGAGLAYSDVGRPYWTVDFASR